MNDPPNEEGVGTGREGCRVDLEAVKRSIEQNRAELERLQAMLCSQLSGAGEDVGPMRRSELDRGPSATAEPSPTTAHDLYGEFAKSELDAQDVRKSSFEQRGLAVITTSGTLVTLLFALAALSTRQADTFTLPSSARTWLMIGLGLFFGAAVAALVTNIPLKYEAVLADQIRHRLKEDPPRGLGAAARDIALTRVKALRSAKSMNGIKGWAVATALGLEALAVGCVAIAITIIL